MRFRWVRGTAAIATSIAALGLAACGSGDTAEAPPTESEAEADAFPVTIEHKFGSTEIAAPPERVVTIGYGEDDFSLSLGVAPVGARDFIGDYSAPERPWAKDLLAESPPEIIGAQELNFEQIAAMQPDLILGVYSFITERDYETLSKLAPTVAQSDEYIDGGVPWQEETLVHGQALGRTAEAEERIAETEKAFADARDRHPEFEGRSLVLASSEGGTLYAYSSEDLRTRFFTDLGFDVAPEIDELADGSFYAEFSEERIDLLDQDVLVLLEGSDTQESYESDPLWTRLDAFREGRVIFVDPGDLFAGALGFSSPLSLPYAIDAIEDPLAAATDDDPSTQPPEVE